MAFLTGLISGLIGPAGGAIAIPIFIAYLNYPITHTIGTNSLLSIAISLAGVIAYIVLGWGIQGLPEFSFGYVNLLQFVFLTVTSLLVSGYAANLASKISVNKLKILQRVTTMNDFLQQDIRYLKGVGEKRAVQLNRLGVFTVSDLLYLLPRRYIDYSDPYQLAYAPFDEACAVKATVLQSNGGVKIKGGRVLFKVLCADETARLELTFFNSEYTVKQLEIGEEYIFYGKATFSNRMQMHSPIFEESEKQVLTGRIFPPSHLTVVVIVLFGHVHSFSAYTLPRGQLFPETLKTFLSSSSTVILQPIGHTIQVSSLFIITPPV